MVDEGTVRIVRRYLNALPQYGIHASKAIVYGSFVRGDTHEWSDIDLIVVAREFDQAYDMATVERLWRATGDADDRIEPIACGEREWETDEARPILEIARQEGVEIAA